MIKLSIKDRILLVFFIILVFSFTILTINEFQKSKSLDENKISTKAVIERFSIIKGSRRLNYLFLLNGKTYRGGDFTILVQTHYQLEILFLLFMTKRIQRTISLTETIWDTMSISPCSKNCLSIRS